MISRTHIDVIFFEHSVKIAETISEKRLKRIAMIDDIQFSLMSGNGTSDAKFILRKITQEELAKLKSRCTCAFLTEFF